MWPLLSSFYHSHPLCANPLLKPLAALVSSLLIARTAPPPQPSLYTHKRVHAPATNLQNNNCNPNQHPHRSFLFRLPHALSCNSILMGFIGAAIHLSAAAQFNYISEPAGLSPHNLQRSPHSRKQQMRLHPAHATTHLHSHIKKSQISLLTMVTMEMKQTKTNKHNK